MKPDSKRKLHRAGFALSVAMLAPAAVARADLKLPAIFGDHMVLQRDIDDTVWGWANPGEVVTVRIGAASATATTGADGRWSAKLPPLPASNTPLEMTVSDAHQTITFHDVLLGDVWLCSGQSNMEFPLKLSNPPRQDDQAANHPQLRLFKVKLAVATEPQKDCDGHWAPSTPTSAADFSAVAYYFGQELLAEPHVPIGLIGSYYGGTRIRGWISRGALQHQHQGWQQNASQRQQAQLKQWELDSAAAVAAGEPAPPHPPASQEQSIEPSAPGNPTMFFNGMIAPLQPFGIKGAVWYQGESDVDEPTEYARQLPTLISDWRDAWHQGDFPFLIVQLPNYIPNHGPNVPDNWPWAPLRDAQLQAVNAIHNTAIAVTIDIGEANNLHPLDKADVGHRLALAADRLAYGNKNIVASGPLYRGYEIDGGKVRIHFSDVGGGLMIGVPPPSPGQQPVAPRDQLSGFTIAGADCRFVPARATIDGDDVIVWSNAVRRPIAVRYGWADNPDVNLYNRQHLPAAPFRTDDWPLYP